MRTASLLALFGIVKREREALVIGASGMGTFYNCRSIVDGNGATLIAGRRDDTRAITKLSLFPNLFNINETAVFGMPVVFNPPMCVGFILAPMLELYLRRSLMRTDGAWLPILSSPVAAVCIFATFVTIGLTIYGKLKKEKAPKEEA